MEADASATLERADGRTTAYRRLGEGPPLVCLAGGPGADARYLRDLGGLDGGYELIVPDARGTGRSDPARDPAGYAFDALAEDLESLCTHLDLDAISVLAHSAACTTALAYAAARPHRLRSLVLVAPSRVLHEEVIDDTSAILARRRDEPWYADAVAARARLTGTVDPAELPELTSALAPAGYARWSDEERAHARLMRPVSREAVLAFWGGSVTGEWVRSRLGLVTAPVLVVTGELDAATGVAAGAAWAGCFPNARHQSMAGAAHIPWIDQPSEFAGLVLRFLGSG
jgi:proline iminopeptidase